METAREYEICATESYLQQLELLTHEIENAFEALTFNDISSLERSISSQDFLVAMALHHLRSLSEREGDKPVFPRERQAEVRAASARLRAVSMKYRELLEHSIHSVELLSALCQTYNGHLKNDCRTRDTQPTWSCEV